MQNTTQHRPQMQSRGKTFYDKFQNATKFYDLTYHIQKSTYKGLNVFYKRYAQIERDYADQVIKLTKLFYSELPDIGRQNPMIVSTLKQIINCIQGTSQLHFNFAQRMMQISSFYNSQYYNAKKKKDNHMKILKTRNQQQYNELKSKQNTTKTALINKEKQICKMLYENLDKITQEENQRMHKIKQQTIIYFSLYKKVCQKQLQSTSQYNIKLIKQQYQLKNQKICSIGEQLRNQFNSYGGEQLQKKNFQHVNTVISTKRDSLKASMILKEKFNKISENQNKIKKMIQNYDVAYEKLVIISVDDEWIGFFNTTIFAKEERRKYARQLNGKIIRNIIYDMLQGHSKSINLNQDEKTVLQIIKMSLKIKSQMPILPNYNCSDLTKYWQQVRSQITDQPYIYHLLFLQQLSKIKSPNFSQLDQLIRKRLQNEIKPNDILPESTLQFVVKSCLLDILLDSLCVSRANCSVLVEGFDDYLRLITKFGEQFFRVHRYISILLLLNKISRYINFRDSKQQLQHIITDSYFFQGRASSLKQKQSNQFQSSSLTKLSSLIINSSTVQLSHFYKIKSSFLNYFKMLLIVQKVGYSSINNFNAKDHFYSCIRCAGYNYLKQSETSCQFFDTSGTITGQERLKNIVESIEDLDYRQIITEYFYSNSPEIAKLLGVGDQIVRNKLSQQFTWSLYDFIQANLALLNEQQGIDRDGYILRLGIILAKLDIENPQNINQYDTFFKVLKLYLESTQKDYDNMLEHSRKTQLWIIQQNSQATPNCIDFCSLLYKPFEFLLKSLKELQKQKKTQYTKKYSQFIKLRLNNILKIQIIKYVNFLYQSLLSYKSISPQITLKPKKIQKLHLLNKQQIQKQKQVFKQLTHRLFNLIFLKDQLEEMICDFIDPEIYKKIDHSIFNIDKLKKIISQFPQYKDILTNIKQIVQVVLMNQQRITSKIANITILHLFSKIWDNIYYQEEKNAIETFFSNATDYKLSEYTFVKYQEIIEDWFITIGKNIPDYFISVFSIHFSKYFFLAIQYEVLNCYKFKFPIKMESIIKYLDSDVTFVTTKMKQRFFDSNIIVQEIDVPFKKLLDDFSTDTTKLASVFEAATLKNDRIKCRYILAILNLRVKDQKAIEFVKKYKSITHS